MSFEMLRFSYLTFITVIVFEYFSLIIIDSSFLWIEYCRKDYEFCPQCFDEKINHEKWDNLLKSDFSTLPVNLVFGTRKVQRVLVNINDGSQKRAVLKYVSNEDVVQDFKELLLRYTINTLSEILKEMYQLESHINSFTFCPSQFDSNFFETFHLFNGNNVSFWMQLWLNPELVVLRAIQNSENVVLKNSVPNVIDWCGFVLLETDTGSDNLIAFYDEPLIKRINLAQQLLEMAIAFSIGINGFRLIWLKCILKNVPFQTHPHDFHYRIYLTDCTPDNIVVDTSTLRISFVDLDSLFIVNSELIKSNQINRHERIDCEQCFAFVPEELCAFHLSDINIFSVCQVGGGACVVKCIYY